ncbi:MAG: hypothetical protein NC548_60200 [Lachnospiraceae bacterium]|nr:hypothetical protein [Lachnospiraceae bacterium]
MVSKEILIQYTDLQQEVKEVREKIQRLEDSIPKIEKRINEIEKGETVKDKVRGGLGGLQSFNIEGVPLKEYEKKKTDLLTKKLLLNNRKSTLKIMEFDLLRKTNEIEEFIASIDDSRMRRIINLRFIEGLSWFKVAERMGNNNTEDGVRMSFNRFMEK